MYTSLTNELPHFVVFNNYCNPMNAAVHRVRFAQHV